VGRVHTSEGWQQLCETLCGGAVRWATHQSCGVLVYIRRVTGYRLAEPAVSHPLPLQDLVTPDGQRCFLMAAGAPSGG
jgi:hypothetical protein